MEIIEVIRTVSPYQFFLICEEKRGIDISMSAPNPAEWNGVVHLYCSDDTNSFQNIPDKFKEKYLPFLGKIGAECFCDKIEAQPGTALSSLLKESKCPSKLANIFCLEETSDDNDKTFYLWHLLSPYVHKQPTQLSDFCPSLSERGFVDGWRYIDRSKQLNVKTMRDKTGLTQKEFSRAVYNIPVRSIQNWEGDKRDCPEYILKLIEFKLRMDKLIP